MIIMPGVDPNMIANNVEPAYPTHPGSILKDEIEYRGISQRKLAEQMGMGVGTDIEPVSADRRGNPPQDTLLHQLIEIPVYSTQADVGLFLFHAVVDHLRCGVVQFFIQGVEDALPLTGVFHSRSPKNNYSYDSYY